LFFFSWLYYIIILRMCSLGGKHRHHHSNRLTSSFLLVPVASMLWSVSHNHTITQFNFYISNPASSIWRSLTEIKRLIKHVQLLTLGGAKSTSPTSLQPISPYIHLSVSHSHTITQSLNHSSTFTFQIQPPAYGAAYNAQAGGISMQVPMQAPRCLFVKMKKKRMMRECLNECLFPATTHWISQAEKAVSSHSLTSIGS